MTTDIIPLVCPWGQEPAKFQSQTGALKVEAFHRKAERNWMTSRYVCCSSVKIDIYWWTAPTNTTRAHRLKHKWHNIVPHEQVLQVDTNQSDSHKGLATGSQTTFYYQR